MLQPYGLGGDQFFTWNEQSREEALARNRHLKPSDFLLPREGAPFLILSTSSLGPPKDGSLLAGSGASCALGGGERLLDLSVNLLGAILRRRAAALVDEERLHKHGEHAAVRRLPAPADSRRHLRRWLHRDGHQGRDDLPVSPHVSPYLPISPYRSPRAE